MFFVAWTQATDASLGWLDSFAAQAEQLATHLYAHRTSLITVGIASFLIGALPLAGVVHARLALTSWHVLVFAASVPLVLWSLGVALLATYFHPIHGLVGSANRSWRARAVWARQALRAYAAFSVTAFGLAPFVVLLSAPL